VAERRYSAPAFRQGSALVPRYYFHFADGQLLHDDTGEELVDVAAAKHEALRVSAEMIRERASATAPLWNGTAWRLWVTDKPDGEGETFFTLRFSAEM
jgi:hypothetical protein